MRLNHRQAVYGSQQPLPTFHLDDDQIVANQALLTALYDGILSEMQRLLFYNDVTLAQIVYEQLLISNDTLAVVREIRDSLNSVIAGGAVKVVGV